MKLVHLVTPKQAKPADKDVTVIHEWTDISGLSLSETPLRPVVGLPFARLDGFDTA
jgi:hypothetical protein